MDHGALNIYCLDCHRFVDWHKEHIVSDDGFYDWRIVAACGCGESQDPEIQAMARAAYDRASVNEVYAMQESAMESLIGPGLNRILNRMIDYGQCLVTTEALAALPEK